MNHDLWNWDKINEKRWRVNVGGESHDVKYDVWYSKIPGRKKWLGIGVDPGRHFAICTLDGREAWIFSATFPKQEKKWRYGIFSYELMSNPRRYHGKGKAVVEGPAFKSQFGESNLAHVRMGFVLGLHYAGYNVAIVPPATIRAQALGKGSLGGLEVWPELSHNGGDALATALYSAGLKKEEVKGSHLP